MIGQNITYNLKATNKPNSFNSALHFSISVTALKEVKLNENSNDSLGIQANTDNQFHETFYSTHPAMHVLKAFS